MTQPNNLIKGAWMLLCLGLSGVCMASTQHHKSVPVLDAQPSQTEIKSFRSPLWEKSQAPKELCQGIDKLQVSASGQYNLRSFLNTFKHVPNDKIVVLDLRLESHGFVDGTPISWYGKKNAINQGLTLDQITEKERLLLTNLSQNGTHAYHHITKKTSGIIETVEERQLVTQNVVSEQDLLKSIGANYKRLPVLDRNPPDDLIMDEFVNFVESLPEDKWLHIHCRGGKGRASTFMIMYDIIQNANEVSLDTIFDRQAFFGEKDLRVLPTAPEKLWKRPMSEQRLQKIMLFYHYRLSDEYLNTPWSIWSKQATMT